MYKNLNGAISEKLKNNAKTIFMNYLKFHNSKQEMNLGKVKVDIEGIDKVKEADI